MKVQKPILDEEELEAVYQIVKSYEDELPEDMEDYWHYHNDFDEEPIEKEIISSILKKVGRALPEKNKTSIDKDFLRKKYHSFNNDINEKAYSVIEKAFDQLRTIEIEYFNMQSAKFKKRKLDIYHKSRKYVIGYCHLRKDIRKFRTSRVASAKLTKNKYEVPESFNKNDH